MASRVNRSYKASPEPVVARSDPASRNRAADLETGWTESADKSNAATIESARDSPGTVEVVQGLPSLGPWWLPLCRGDACSCSFRAGGVKRWLVSQ